VLALRRAPDARSLSAVFDGLAGVSTGSDRLRAAEMAREYRAGRVSWVAFMDAFAESSDELVADLVDLIEHEPRRGGLLGISDGRWAEHESAVQAAIDALERT